MATAAFWRTFNHDGKITQVSEAGGTRPTPFTILPSGTKLQCTLQLRGQISDMLPLFHLYTYMYSMVLRNDQREGTIS